VFLMYELAGGFVNTYLKYADPKLYVIGYFTREFNNADPTIRDRVVQLYPPASPYIKKSFEGILMYEMVGGFINKCCKYADPTTICRVAEVQ
jgi:hypothetical protein